MAGGTGLGQLEAAGRQRIVDCVDLFEHGLRTSIIVRAKPTPVRHRRGLVTFDRLNVGPSGYYGFLAIDRRILEFHALARSKAGINVSHLHSPFARHPSRIDFGELTHHCCGLKFIKKFVVPRKFFAATQDPTEPFNPSMFRDHVVCTWSMKT